MGKLFNEILIASPAEKVWKIIADASLLDKYDPTIKGVTLLSAERTGAGAKRKVTMLDDKNWFEEEVTVFIPQYALTYTLTACSFPIHGLQHSYSFETSGEKTLVKQIMEYRVKYGILGKLLDKLVMRKQFDNGIKKFFAGLKSYAETN